MNNENKLEDYHYTYSEYYDLLTSHKSYLDEVNLLLKYLRGLGFGTSSSIISVGCGTGAHERLIARYVKEILGIDQSSHMISVAKRKSHEPNLSFTDEPVVSVAQSYYDVGLSLFNVINCVESADGLLEFIEQLGGAIRHGGIIMLEAWNSVEISANPPSIVTRCYSDSDTRLIRKATPTFIHDKKQVIIDYAISGKQGGKDLRFESRHNIYLHSRELIEACLNSAGFKNVSWYSALSDGLRVAERDDRMLLVSAQKLQ